MSQITDDCRERETVGRSFDRVFADRHRRWVLWSLVDGPDERDLSDLTEVVARRESASEEDSDVDTHVVAIRLYHVHLPKLDDAGFVSFDTGTNVVSLTAPESEVKFRLGQRVGLDS